MYPIKLGILSIYPYNEKAPDLRSLKVERFYWIVPEIPGFPDFLLEIQGESEMLDFQRGSESCGLLIYRLNRKASSAVMKNYCKYSKIWRKDKNTRLYP